MGRCGSGSSNLRAGRGQVSGCGVRGIVRGSLFGQGWERPASRARRMPGYGRRPSVGVESLAARAVPALTRGGMPDDGSQPVILLLVAPATPIAGGWMFPTIVAALVAFSARWTTRE
jgi:hypothetical protein